MPSPQCLYHEVQTKAVKTSFFVYHAVIKITLLSSAAPLYLVTTQLDQQTIGHKLDVATHQCAVHADQRHWQCVSKEFLLNGDGITDDLVDTLLRRTVHNVREQQACEISMQPL